MTAIPLLGAPVVAQITERIQSKVSELKQSGINPLLAIVDATGDEASACYARMKVKKANMLGIETRLITLSPDTDPKVFIDKLNNLSQDTKVHGIFIERPLPEQLNQIEWTKNVPPQKDVEGEHPINVGKSMLGLTGKEPVYVPATAAACIELLNYYNISVAGRHTVIVGRSVTVGRPLSWLFINKDATVTVCHSKTVDLPSFTKKADILAVAAGQAGLINGSMISQNTVVLDVGVNYDKNGKVVGDVDYPSVNQIAYALTPPVGGLGPITTMLLLENVVTAAIVANK